MFDRNEVLRSYRCKCVRLVSLSMGVALALLLAGPAAAGHEYAGVQGPRVRVRHASALHRQREHRCEHRHHRYRGRPHHRGFQGYASGHRKGHHGRRHVHGFGLGIFLPFLALEIDEVSHHGRRRDRHASPRRGSGDWRFVAAWQ